MNSFTSQQGYPALLIRKQDAADMLALSLSKLEKMMAAGQIPYTKIDSAVRFRLEDLHAFVAARTFVQKTRKEV